MAQHDLDVANGSGSAVRADINNALLALGSTMKGPNAPSAPQAGMLWIEDDNPSSTRWTLWVYDGAAWISLGVIDTDNNDFEPASTATGLALIQAASAAAARSAISAPATPNTTGSGTDGYWYLVAPGSGVAAALPSGGTWAYFIFLINGSGAFAGGSGYAASVAAGGSTIGSATPSNAWIGVAWRIA
jgi:hypothetical protein